MTEINCDDFWEHQTKKQKSYLGRIPSQNFSEEEYTLYLQCAEPYELEEDILTEETYVKIMKTLIYEEMSDPEDPTCWNYSEARLRRMK